MKKNKPSISASSEAAEKPVSGHIPNPTGARRSVSRPRRVNVDFPAWMVASLDDEAARLGITRQSLIKMWLGERLADRR